MSRRFIFVYEDPSYEHDEAELDEFIDEPEEDELVDEDLERTKIFYQQRATSAQIQGVFRA